MIERYRRVNSHLPDVAAGNKIRSAIKAIDKDVRVPRPHSDSITPLCLGGPLAFSDLEHVQGLLELVNRPAIGDVSPSDIRESADGVVDSRFVSKSERMRLTMTLDLIIGDINRGNVESRRVEWMRKIRGHVVRVPSFDGQPDKTLVTDHLAARRYVLLLLSDRERPFISQLRRCDLESCGRYFLDTETRPGQRRLYCDPTCASEADKIAARVRAKEWRDSKKNAVSSRRKS